MGEEPKSSGRVPNKGLSETERASRNGSARTTPSRGWSVIRERSGDLVRCDIRAADARPGHGGRQAVWWQVPNDPPRLESVDSFVPDPQMFTEPRMQLEGPAAACGSASRWQRSVADGGIDTSTRSARGR